jgi:hypothetical protein
LLGGDGESARPPLLAVATANVEASGVARLLVALIDAGRGTDVAPVLDALAESPAESPAIRDVARLGTAYTRYWSGDFTGAATAFEAATDLLVSPNLVDDAYYGAAWSRVRAGDAQEGRHTLLELARAGDSREREHSISADLVNLHERALLRAGFRRYRRGPLQPPEQSIADFFDQDGPALARAALRLLGRETNSAKDVTDGGRPDGATSRVLPFEESPPVPAEPRGFFHAKPEAGSAPPGSRHSWSLGLPIALLGVVLWAAWFAVRRRHHPTAGR